MSVETVSERWAVSVAKDRAEHEIARQFCQVLDRVIDRLDEIRGNVVCRMNIRVPGEVTDDLAKLANNLVDSALCRDARSVI